MQRGPTGSIATTHFGPEAVRAFVPHPLPPIPRSICRGLCSAKTNGRTSPWVDSTA